MRVRTVFLVRCDIFKISSALREIGRGVVQGLSVKTKINPPQKKKKKKKIYIYIYIYILGPKINASPSPEKKKTFSCQNFWA